MSKQDKKTFFSALVIVLMLAVVAMVSSVGTNTYRAAAVEEDIIIDLPPLLPEDCNDNDVDGFVVYEIDMPSDWDGFMSPTCHDIIGWGDCNDNDMEIFPGAVDPVGDGIDQNCDAMDGTDPGVEVKVYPLEEPLQ